MSETDDPLTAIGNVFNGTLTRSGATRMKSGLDRDDVSCDSADGQRGADPSNDIRRALRPAGGEYVGYVYGYNYHWPRSGDVSPPIAFPIALFVKAPGVKYGATWNLRLQEGPNTSTPAAHMNTTPVE